MKDSLIKKFEQRMADVETRLTQLECPHKRVRFIERQENTIVSYGPNRRICAACGKLLEVYPTRESFLAAKADHTEEELINLRQRLDKERSVSDARTLDASKIAVTDLSATGITKTKKAKE
jgi:hypothetical protein